MIEQKEFKKRYVLDTEESNKKIILTKDIDGHFIILNKNGAFTVFYEGYNAYGQEVFENLGFRYLLADAIRLAYAKYVKVWKEKNEKT